MADRPVRSQASPAAGPPLWRGVAHSAAGLFRRRIRREDAAFPRGSPTGSVWGTYPPRGVGACERTVMGFRIGDPKSDGLEPARPASYFFYIAEERAAGGTRLIRAF